MNLPLRALLPLLLALPLAAQGPQAAPAPKVCGASEIRKDFQDLYQGLRAAHFDIYARRSKGEYDRLYARTLKGFTRPMSRSTVQEAFQRFMAFGRVAHARIQDMEDGYGAFRAGGGKAFPLSLRMVEGRSYVVGNLSGQTGIALGDELLSIDGRPMKELLRQVGQALSADNDYLLNTLMENQFPSLLWKAWGEKQAFSLTLRRNGKDKYSTTVKALSRPEALAELQRQPPTLELAWDKREARILPEGVAYLRPGPFYNVDSGATDPWDNASFLKFIDDAFSQFLKAGATRLLIDLRDNPGGDNSFSDAMVAWLAAKPFRFTSDFRVKVSTATTASNAQRLAQSPAGSISHRFAAAYAAHRPGEVFSFDMPMAQPRPGTRFTGKTYLLINRHSYSNTVTVAAMAQDDGMGQILGEETADLATTYGAMESFILPRTGIRVGYPKAHILRPNGDTKARSVIPDIAIATPIVPTQEDVVLRKALEIVSR